MQAEVERAVAALRELSPSAVAALGSMFESGQRTPDGSIEIDYLFAPDEMSVVDEVWWFLTEIVGIDGVDER